MDISLVRCQSCFVLPKQGMKVYLTNCRHVICGNCKQKGENNVCKNARCNNAACQFLQINDAMPDKYKRLFMKPEKILSDKAKALEMRQKFLQEQARMLSKLADKQTAQKQKMVEFCTTEQKIKKNLQANLAANNEELHITKQKLMEESEKCKSLQHQLDQMQLGQDANAPPSPSQRFCASQGANLFMASQGLSTQPFNLLPKKTDSHSRKVFLESPSVTMSSLVSSQFNTPKMIGLQESGRKDSNPYMEMWRRSADRDRNQRTPFGGPGSAGNTFLQSPAPPFTPLLNLSAGNLVTPGRVIARPFRDITHSNGDDHTSTFGC